MPNLTQSGENVRIYNNEVTGNNTKNFGHKGTPVASVPAGSGIVVTSHDNVEIFGNRLTDNRTANVIISSVHSTGWVLTRAEESFDPYPERIHVHDNIYSGGGQSPDGLDLKTLKTLMFGLNGRLPDVLWDGYMRTNLDNAQICINEKDIEVLNADQPNGNANPRLEPGVLGCELPALEEITLAKKS